MQLVKSALVLAVVLLLAIPSTRGANNICDTCKCTSVGSTVKDVLCDCTTPNQELNITLEAMSGLEHIEAFSVSNCSGVNFHKNSFANSHDLGDVVVKRVGHLTLPVGVFSSLHSLRVEDVSDLRMLEMALMGSDIRNIAIHRSNISVLPSHALYDIIGLESVELKDVHIDVIMSKAIDIRMAKDSSFVIDSCEVDSIESDGITLSGSILRILNSSLHNVSNFAVRASASLEVDVETTFFGAGCSDHGIIVSSNNIRITHNTFNTLPIGLLTVEKNSKSSVTFNHNNVYEFSLGTLSEMANLENFTKNEIVCDCALADGVPAFIAMNRMDTTHILEENYCHLVSKCKISLKDFVKNQNCDHVDTVDEYVIDYMCANQPMTSPAYLSTSWGSKSQPPITTEASRLQETTESFDLDGGSEAVISGRTASTGRNNVVSAILITIVILTCTARYI